MSRAATGRSRFAVWTAGWRRLTLLSVGALLLACGGGGGGGGGGGTAPTISDLIYSPLGTYLGSGSGTATVSGNMLFTDPDGDLASWTLTLLDASGMQLQSTTTPIQGASGLTSGGLNAVAVVSTATLGTYTFRIQVTDARGNRSGALSGTFRITAPPWTTLTVPPAGRTGFATATLGGRIYVLGGADSAPVIPPPPSSRVDIFDPATSTWSAGVPMPVPMQDFGAAVVGGRIVAIGGGLGTTQVQEFDPVGGGWTVRASPPASRQSAGVAAAGGRVYWIGGDGGGFETAANASFDPAGNQWRSEASMPTARRRLSAVSVDVPVAGGATAARVFALGGYGSTRIPDAGYFPTNEAFDPVANAWQTRATMPTPAAGVALAAFDGRILAFGGDNVARSIDTVMRYDPVADAWAYRMPMPAPEAGAKAEVVGRRIYVFSATATYVYAPDDEIW